jgi:hypothetical protein
VAAAGLHGHAVDQLDPFGGVTGLVDAVADEDASLVGELREQARAGPAATREQHRRIDGISEHLAAVVLKTE